MSNPTDLKLSKPAYALFFAGDLLLLGIGACIYARFGNSALGASLFFLGGALGAMLAVTPFVLEYRAAVKMVETGALVSTLDQLRNIEAIAQQIGAATGQWQVAQEHAARTTSAAQDIAGRMSEETAAFMEFMQKANDSEKANLRLEVEKLRRAEGDFLQVAVRMLDHVYALHQAGVRSGQTALIEQFSQFQNACRDAARRIGLIPFAPAVNEPFDAKLHQLSDPKAAPAPEARIRETIATGYTFQGKLIRPSLVVLQTPPPAVEDTAELALSDSKSKADETLVSD